MSAIVNIGPLKGEDVRGRHKYEIRINHKVITQFVHRRSDQLSQCLFLAFEAVDREDRQKVIRILDAEKKLMEATK